MGKGKKRNQPCWCGSGKKYKNCHEKREYEEKVEIYEIDKDLRSSYSKKRCLAPKELIHECSRKVIKAHTVSKSSNLKQIAKDGHVLSFKKSIQDLVKHNGKFPVEKVGINSASIINGFCSKHDKELFAIIEDVKFTFTNEQIFMLAYRGISRELYLKYSSIQVQEKISTYDKGKSKQEQIIFQNLVNTINKGTLLAIRDFEKVKDVYDKALLEKNFDNLKYYCIKINSIPEIMSSCAWIPESDFNNKLANLSNESVSFNLLTVSTIALEDNKGAIIFAWYDLTDDNYCSLFIKSLDKIPNKYKSNAILEWLFKCNENIYWSETWWESINSTNKELLITSYMNILETSLNLQDYEKYNLLSWDKLEIITNIKL